MKLAHPFLSCLFVPFDKLGPFCPEKGNKSFMMVRCRQSKDVKAIYLSTKWIKGFFSKETVALCRGKSETKKRVCQPIGLIW